ncbi:hypothetical protein F6J84_12810 [Microbacterium caowuchunii]|uniref:hypothetical protein n=1 Tax=Microbacterium caowuchunii TaxID=2614638 RepID=UPI0012439DB5|nr:hypothetical protein [Microbacterium caowuchunii]QEW00898.1 hypothetical protein F6J84_12810 [Microbacterium caowuchunii]
MTSGRFFTWWSAAVSLLASVTVLGSYFGVTQAQDYPAAVGVSAIGWAVIAALVLPVAWAERRVRSPRGRAALVLATLVAVSVLRPFLNDAIAAALLPTQPSGGWAQRIATNLLVWVLLLSLVAIATVGYAGSRSVGRRLRSARAALAAAGERAAVFERQAQAELDASFARIRTGLETLRTGRPGFEDVRAFSAVVREASHRLEDVARTELPPVAGDVAPAAPPVGSSRPILSRLRPPPPFTVAGIYFAASLPYIVTVAPWYLVLLSIVALALLSGAADVLSRRLGARRPPSGRGATLIVVWAGAGAVYSAVAFALHPESGGIVLVPILAFPGIAVAIALCADAGRRSIVQERLLTSALAAEAAALAALAARTRASLDTAAERLHGHVQGRCVVFAAALDERDATTSEAEAFAVTIDRALEEMRHGATDGTRASDVLADVITSWTNVLRISSEIDPAARSVLADAGIRRRVADIAAEAFVNAVKHSGARSAELSVRPADEPGQALLVEVAAPGVLADGLRMRGRGLAHLSARAYQRGADVVLEASVPDPVADGPVPASVR